ncbi:hypothetical protein D6783_02825 [Candidatus Woesearchaeota archaeon]|nr:MAG: hypothetical protein D6783_02825 [Candidatus Woesearchaeota archaeon]
MFNLPEPKKDPVLLLKRVAQHCLRMRGQHLLIFKGLVFCFEGTQGRANRGDCRSAVFLQGC